MEGLEKAIEKIKQEMPKLDLREHESMREHCSFRVGGEVSAYAAPKDIFEMSKVMFYLHMNDVAPLTVGKCTNLIIPEEGLDIMVISTENLQKIRLGEKENTIYAEAGVSLAKLAQFAQANGLSGLEFASGIPGSVGGGVLMNAGAYGGEMKDVVESVVVYYIPDQALTEVRGEDCGFAYRHSNFERVSCAIMGTVFRLTPDDPDAIAARMREMNEKRRNSQPLDMPSAGSAFKRPVGGYAAALIDQCGLKGHAVGGAQISEKHAGFAVNTGSATYDDVVALLDHVRREVYAKTNITLEPEIRIYPKGMLLVDDWRLRKQSIMQQMQEAAESRAAAAKEQGEVKPS
ncbi:MAG: UDP-N-acetylmuramate dehydrogenase [Oscillospiraceae bacterium]|nr:UDP-N-acetylmuramate dehydrogenase [Oscillospiraceae bacterium]